MRAFRVMRIGKMGTAAFAAATVVLLACSAGGRDNDGPGQVPSDRPSEQTGAPEPVKPSLPAGAFGTGMYEVGRDIKAGTFTCVTRDGDVSGYWERARDASGTAASIISNDSVPAGAQAIVTVKKGEFFKVDRLVCKPR